MVLLVLIEDVVLLSYLDDFQGTQYPRFTVPQSADFQFEVFELALLFSIFKLNILMSVSGVERLVLCC